MLQFIQLNAQQKDQFGNPMINPMTGQPIMDERGWRTVRSGYRMDEGPGHHYYAQQDVYETLIADYAHRLHRWLRPAEASAYVSILIDSSSLSASAEKDLAGCDRSSSPDPMQAAGQAEIALTQGEAAKVGETQSKTQLNFAKAQQAGSPQGDPSQLPPQIHLAKAVARTSPRRMTYRGAQAGAGERGQRQCGIGAAHSFA